MLPSILSLPALSVSKGRRAGKAAVESATAYVLLLEPPQWNDSIRRNDSANVRVWQIYAV